MAKVFVIPVIRREDYSAFRRDVGLNLAETYEQWAKLFAGEVDAARRQGKTVVEKEVRYDEFLRHCAAMGIQPDSMTLLDFAARQKPLGEA